MQTRTYKARLAMAGFFVWGAVIFLVGCAHVRPWRVVPTPTMVDYSPFDCAALDTEARRLEKLIAWNANSYRHGVREKLSVLRGQADAVDQQIVLKGCHVLPVDLTISQPHHAHSPPPPTAIHY